MSDRSRLKKGGIFTECKKAQLKKKTIVRNANKSNYISVNLWKATKIYHTFDKETHSRQKEIPHHFTADAFNDYFLSIAETLVKSQDVPDSDKTFC